jgi:transposase
MRASLREALIRWWLWYCSGGFVVGLALRREQRQGPWRHSRHACCVCVYGSVSQKEKEREEETGKLQSEVTHTSTSMTTAGRRGAVINTIQGSSLLVWHEGSLGYPPFPEPTAEHVKARCPSRVTRQARPPSDSRRKRPYLSQAPSPIALHPPHHTSQNTKMPRKPIDISAQRQTITWWITQEKWTMSRVMETLAIEHGISISENTLKRNLNAWDIRVRPHIKVTPEMRQRIYDLFYQERYYTDQQMAKILRRDGFTISFRKLAKLRKEMGLSKRKDTIIPANPVVPGEVIRVEDDAPSSDDDDDEDDAEEDEDDMNVDPIIALENAMRPQQTTQQSTPQSAPQIREPVVIKKRPGDSVQPVHQAPRIAATFTNSRHSPVPPSRPHVRSLTPPMLLDIAGAPTDTETYSQPPANGQGLARRVTTLVTRIEAIEIENASLKQQTDQQRTENQELRQLVQQQRDEMDMMRASLNELIVRFNAAHYQI